jgi:hypothetical protein
MHKKKTITDPRMCVNVCGWAAKCVQFLMGLHRYVTVGVLMGRFVHVCVCVCVCVWAWLSWRVSVGV